MGLVARQAFKYALSTYALTAISVLAVIFIYPMDNKLYGLYSWILRTYELLIPFVLIGSTSTMLRFFPANDTDDQSRMKVLFAANLSLFIGTTMLLLVYLLFGDYFLAQLDQKSSLVSAQTILPILFVGIVLYALLQLLKDFVANYKRVVIPNIVDQSTRIATPILFLLVYYDYLSVATSLWIYMGILLCLCVVLLVYLHSLQPLMLVPFRMVWNYLSDPEVYKFMIFSLMTALGSKLAFTLDEFMVGAQVSIDANGVYSIANRIGTMISIPTFAILAIASPIVSGHMNSKNYDEVHKFYKQTSNLLNVIGAIFLAILAAVLIDLLNIMPNTSNFLASNTISIVALIALARYFDMITSFNSQVIIYSEKYAVNLYLLIFLGLLNSVLNYILIGRIGPMGAAVSTFISLTLYNIIKMLYVWFQFRMWPFNRQVLFVLPFSLLVAYTLATAVDTAIGSYLIRIAVKTTAIGGLLTMAFYYNKTSLEFNQLIDKILVLVRLK